MYRAAGFRAGGGREEQNQGPQNHLRNVNVPNLPGNVVHNIGVRAAGCGGSGSESLTGGDSTAPAASTSAVRGLHCLGRAVA